MRRRRREDSFSDGSSLIEVMVAMGVLMTVLLGFQTMLVTALKTYSGSRDRTIGTQIANDEIENDRRMNWSDLGTVSGAAPGTISPTRQVTKNGVTYKIDTFVEYVDDPVDPTFSIGSNYKHVVVTVTALTNRTAPVVLETYVAPPTQPSRSKGAIRAQVLDLVANTPIPGAQVRLLGGPSAIRVGVANADGKVSFGDLTPTTLTGAQSKYQIEGSMGGYNRIPEDDPTQATVSTTLDPSQVWSTVVHVYQPVTLEIDVVDWLGRAVTTGGSIAVSGDAASQTFTLPASGHLSISTVGTKNVRPDKTYTVTPSIPGQTLAAASGLGAPSYTAGDRTGNFTFNLPRPPDVTQQVKLVDQFTLAVPSGVAVTITDGPATPGTSTATTNGSGIVNFTVTPDSQLGYTLHVPAGPTWAATDIPIVITASSAATTQTKTLNGSTPIAQLITIQFPAAVPAVAQTVTLTGGPGNVSLSQTSVAGAVTFTVVPHPTTPYIVHVPAGLGWSAADVPVTVGVSPNPFVVVLAP